MRITFDLKYRHFSVRVSDSVLDLPVAKFLQRVLTHHVFVLIIGRFFQSLFRGGVGLKLFRFGPARLRETDAGLRCCAP